eukprot:scaffold30597_cov67-Attheya_sp.AAC.1
MGRKVMGNDTEAMRPTQSTGRWEAWREAWRWKAGQQSSGRRWWLRLGRPSWICSWTWHCVSLKEDGLAMGTEVGLWTMCFNFDIQSAEGGGLGNGGGCILGVAFGGPGAVGDAGAVGGFVVIAGRWFHCRKVGRN